MSEDDETACCASCGIAEIDDIKLKKCDGCDLVRYCSDECRENHKSVHEEDCKKRAAELRDELLFKQPESSHMGDCPICCLPIPLGVGKATFLWCCSKTICLGCTCANMTREQHQRLQPACPFCRKSMHKVSVERDKLVMKRVKANDLNAMWQQGVREYEKGDYNSAFEYLRKAATLGSVVAHRLLAVMYERGQGVEKDEGKASFHLEEAAIGGHPDARYDLGCHEKNINNNPGRAVRHFIIAAALGEVKSIKELIHAFRSEVISKEELDAALRAHQDVLDAMKSPQRKIAEEILSKNS